MRHYFFDAGVAAEEEFAIRLGRYAFLVELVASQPV